MLDLIPGRLRTPLHNWYVAEVRRRYENAHTSWVMYGKHRLKTTDTRRMQAALMARRDELHAMLQKAKAMRN